MILKYWQSIISEVVRNNFIYGFILLQIVFALSCNKIVDVDAPYTSINAGNVFKDEDNAIAVLTGIYAQISQSNTFAGSRSINLFAGLSGDELTLYNGVTQSDYISYYRNALIASPNQSFGSENWSALYDNIYRCNAAIEGLEASNALTSGIKQQLLGEAKFLRAFFYFYLVNLYGDVPLPLSTDYKTNALLPRSSISTVHQQIIMDLNEAKNLLSSDYLDGHLIRYSGNSQEERVRPTKWAALSLLSRAQLYAGNWAAADSSASAVIANTALYDTVALNNVFLKNSKEAIWQLQPVNSGRNTEDAMTFIVSDGNPPSAYDRPVYLSRQLLDSFESNDQRRVIGNWVDNVTLAGITYYFPFKYKNNGSTVTEYFMVLRLGEQYLIRAEARTHLGNNTGAISDLNVIRQRAGLTDYVGPITQASILSGILHERQVELFTEWGHRWLDLKRTRTVGAVMTVVTSIKSQGIVQWQSYQQLYPLLFSDLIKDPNLSQNPGY